MIEINELYLVQTVDKSPYVFEFDTNVFNILTPSTTKDLTIAIMELIESNAFHFSECFKGYFEHKVKNDFESGTPRVVALDSRIGTSIYDYKFIMTRENDTKEFNADFKDDTRYLASHNWQIIYKSKGNWFICYAEFSLMDALVNNDVIQPLIFESQNSKEEIYPILLFGTA